MDIVPDTSALIDSRVTDKLTTDSVPNDNTVIIPEAVVSELEAQANDDQQTGWDGLTELQQLAELSDTDDTITITYVGDRPSPSDAANAHKGNIDAVIRDVADEHDATLLTSDTVQADVARAKGLTVEYTEPVIDSPDTLAIEEFFDASTLSVHLKAGAPPKAKRGSISDMQYKELADTPSTPSEMEDWITDIETSVTTNDNAFIELSYPGMQIVQFNDYRIAIARPPFAEAIEITAVRPLVKTTLDDYDCADTLRDRLADHQRGVLVSGAPGAGKSTFAQAVAEFLNDNNYAVKTMENPRDLQVGADITQYGPLGGDMENTADSLLLVRPDYTIYDEVRNTSDFDVFSDMRLAGVGMVGVVHATRAIDALQRLVGRVELGMIPQIVDTVVYLDSGNVDTVYDITTEVKVPHGMQSEDLARPVIQVTNFETDTPEYEIYTFNRQVVTVPLDDVETSETTDGGTSRLAKRAIEREFRSLTQGPLNIEVTGEHSAIVHADDDDISKIIGRNGDRIDALEQELGVSLDVRPYSEYTDPDTQQPQGQTQPQQQAPETTPLVITPTITDDTITFSAANHQGETVEIHADNTYLFTATVGDDGTVNLSRGTTIATELESAIENNKQLTITP